MLPLCDKRVSLPRADVAPVWTRSFPITKEPITLGEHLKKKRFIAGMRQEEAARILKVSARTLSLWECDQIYPAWAYQPRIVAYLGFDPFDDPALGRPKGNETRSVASSAPESSLSIGEKILQFRLKSRKTRQQLAKEWGICPKTLWGWETGIREPSRLVKKRMKGLE